MKVFYASLLIFSICSYGKQSLTLAVGHDHAKMIKHYSFYAASWQIINDELHALGYNVSAKPYPWARAKEGVKKAKYDGLFLAANFKGRENWAEFTIPLGQDQFGLFYNKQSDPQLPLGAVRLLSNYSQLSFLDPDNQVKLSTAQEGLMLLHNKKLRAFVMSRSYGEYILSNELQIIKSRISFNEALAEMYTAHIAVSKTHPRKDEIINTLNSAINNAIRSGRYSMLMEAYDVAPYQLITH